METVWDGPPLDSWAGFNSWTCHCIPHRSGVQDRFPGAGFQFSPVSQSCPNSFPPVDCSMPGFPVLHAQSLLKLMSIQVVMPSNHLILCHPLLFLPSTFPSIRVFPVSQFFASGGQSIGASASASVLPMNIED